MFFQNFIETDKILELVRQKIEAMRPTAKYGFDIEVKEHIRRRTDRQNAFYFEVLAHICDFSRKTGYMPDKIKLPYVDNSMLHAFFKCRFNIRTTTKLTTGEFTEYIDQIQNLVCEQSNGDYDPLIIENNYLEKTGLTNKKE